ncbi:MAG: DUF362 domain-containing protein [Candidatus Heimdallarchaeota archaeon]
MSTKIAIVNIDNYESVPKAVVAAIRMIEKDLNYNINDCSNILLKPNLLRANKDACTQPEFVEGIIEYLKQSDISMETVKIGDSPGQIRVFASDIAKKVGLYEICEKEGLTFVDFEKEVPVKQNIRDACRLKEYYVSKAVKDCDLLINLPKLKTHGEATITGAVKNYWGIIPGGLKAKFHLLGKNPNEFGETLADNYAWVVQNKPKRLIIYDLQRVMQGPMGPVSGPMKKWNLIMVGTDELALDLIALEIGRFNGMKRVPHLRSASKRGLGISDFKDIEIVGLSLEQAKKSIPKFKVPGRKMTKFASFITGSIVYKVTKRVPKVKKKLCRHCKQCFDVCPANAIALDEEMHPYFVKKQCISCLCCLEVCPHQAIKSKQRGFLGLIHSY